MVLADQPSDAASEQLRRVQAVTDAALAHLTLEGLLDELLSRVRELLSVDTAVVLLLDEEGKELVATAAKGIEEEVEQGVRVPLGRGFAGRVAATGQPVILRRVETGTVVNPLLIQRRLATLLGVPLVVQGEVIGVMHVGSLVPREFTDDDVALLQLVGDRIALAVRARVEEGRRVITATLQRSLLPDVLPTIGDIEIAGRYMPAHGGMVGGDWYDVFLSRAGALCVVVGDVVGKGLDAAIAMSRLRNAVRALALLESDPGPMLARVNDVLLHFDPGVMATMLFGVIDENGVMRYANAGHVPPLLVRPDEPSVLVEESSEPALGAVSHTYRTRELLLPPGASLFFYTDGLVERRGVTLDRGLATLQRAVDEIPWVSLEDLCSRVLASEDATPTNLDDDLAILVLRRRVRSPAEEFHAEIDADPAEVATVRRQLRRWLSTTDADAQETQDILVAACEAIANSVEHAYGPGQGSVIVDAAVRDNGVTVTVRDHGRWRPPRGSHRGRGRTLMTGLMDDVTFETTDAGTSVTLRKTFAREQAHAVR